VRSRARTSSTAGRCILKLKINTILTFGDTSGEMSTHIEQWVYNVFNTYVNSHKSCVIEPNLSQVHTYSMIG